MANNSQVANQNSGKKKTFMAASIAELKKVIWPTREELINHEIVVIAFTLLATAAIWVFDFGFSSLITNLINMK